MATDSIFEQRADACFALVSSVASTLGLAPRRNTNSGYESDAGHEGARPYLARSALPHGASPAIPSVAIPPAVAPPAPSSPPSKSTYFIQLGAFAYLAHARELARQVARIGYRVSITEAAKTGGAIIYRVRIDHAADRSSAEKLVAILKQRISGARPHSPPPRALTSTTLTVPPGPRPIRRRLSTTPPTCGTRVAYEWISTARNVAVVELDAIGLVRPLNAILKRIRRSKEGSVIIV